MSIQILQVSSKADLKRFIRLPASLPDRRPNAVLPLWSDEEAFHDPARNPALRECDHVCFLALRDGAPMGRIMGIIHAGHNTLHGIRTVRFYQLDAGDDDEVIAGLVGAVEEWGRTKGMDTIIGPFGLSDKDPKGFRSKASSTCPFSPHRAMRPTCPGT
jgi:hypothetical protein